MLDFLRGKPHDAFTELFDSSQPVERSATRLRRKTTDRKLRLFALACGRRVWGILDERSRKVVEVGERYADGLAHKTALEAALERARQFRKAIPSFEEPGYLHFLGSVDNIGYWRCRRPVEEAASELVLGLGPALEAETVASKAVEVASRAARADAWETGFVTGEKVAVNLKARDARGDTAYESTRRRETQEQAVLLRDIFGNPFRPVMPDRSWLTPRSIDLARSMYDHRRFQDMSDLADALDDAGCTVREILDHCRGPGPHVRGCWVVDRVLGGS
jgi:hypothetical protein